MRRKSKKRRKREKRRIKQRKRRSRRRYRTNNLAGLGKLTVDTAKVMVVSSVALGMTKTLSEVVKKS